VASVVLPLPPFGLATSSVCIAIAFPSPETIRPVSWLARPAL
jgi:hypothetical protein